MTNNQKILLLEKMLDYSIGLLIENEICSGCKIFHNPDYRCKNGYFCADLIYEGLLEKLRRFEK